MTVWSRIASWFNGGSGVQQRAVINDPVLAALASRYVQDGTTPNPDLAARKVAVGAAIRLITNTVSSMPADVFRGVGGKRVQILPVPVLIRDPDATGRGMRDWLSQIAWSLATRGNAYGHIVARDQLTGYPSTIIPIHPDLLDARMDSSGRLSWHTTTSGIIPGDDMMHIRLYPVPGKTVGLSPIQQHAAMAGLSMSAERFGASFFDSGGHPTAMLTSPDPLTDIQAEAVKRKFLAATADRSPVLMPDGIKYEAIQITPEESQFLETQKYTAAECARIWGPGMAEMLGYDTASAMTYQNIADRDLHLLKYTINTYLIAIENVLAGYLPGGQYVKLNRNAMLQMNPTARAQLYQVMSDMGATVPNEVRDNEDMPPVPWGDVPYPVTKKTITQALGADGQPVQPSAAGGIQP